MLTKKLFDDKGQAVISTTEMGRLANVLMSAEFIIKTLGVAPYLQTNTGTFWRAEDVHLVFRRLVMHFLKLADEFDKS